MDGGVEVDGPKIAVVGLGSVGSMASWRLAARGAEVVGFEQFGIGHDRSAHGGESRAFRTAYFEDPAYVPMIRHARDLWRQLEREIEASLLVFSGLLLIGDSASMPMTNVFEAIERFDIDAEQIPLESARARWPQHPLLEHDVVILDREAGYLTPELAVWHAASRAEHLGAELRTYTAVTSLDETGDGVRVRTADTDERYDHVVVAAGPWASRLLGEFGSRLENRRLLSAWFSARRPGVFEPDRFPPFGRITAPECYGLPALDGSGLKLGLLGTDISPVADPDCLDRNAPIRDVRAFHALVSAHFPELRPDPYRVTAYMDAYTPDGHGLVGPLPGSERVTVAAGLSGHGFKLVPALGDIAADYGLTGHSPSNLTLLDPDRFRCGR